MAENPNREIEDINFVKEALKSQLNLGFIGVMGFLMLVINFWAFLPLLVAGQLGAMLLAQSPLVQRVIRLRKVWEQKLKTEESETEIVQALPANYQADFQSVKNLCEEIERRSGELDTEKNNKALADVVAKLSAFRYEYARMQRAHHLLATRNYRQLQLALDSEIARAERAVEREDAAQVRYALSQNLGILRRRQERIQKLSELVRLLEARLQVIKNSLGLIQDEVYSFTNVAGIQGMVDNLLINLSISDEFRADYEDVLNVDESETSLTALEDEPRGREAAVAAGRSAAAIRKQMQR